VLCWLFWEGPETSHNTRKIAAAAVAAAPFWSTSSQRTKHTAVHIDDEETTGKPPITPSVHLARFVLQSLSFGLPL
jgi:hypothetical protein